MQSSFAWRYANARKGKFQFRLRQDRGSAGTADEQWPYRFRLKGAAPVESVID
jgi:hypothetical protein